jgi:hypothetical protein
MAPALAVLTVLSGACSADPSATKAPATDKSDSATSTEPGSPKARDTRFDPDAPPLPGGVRVLSQETDDFVPLDAGRYGMRVTDSLLYQVDVPANSEVYDGTNLNPGSGSAAGRNGILWLEPADEDTALPADPCRDHTMNRVGPTVEDLATALADQPFLAVTKPTPVTVGGMDGQFVKMAVPLDADVSSCQDGRVQLMGNINDPPDLYGQGPEPGVVERMWILDIDGERHIIHANVITGPDTSNAEEHTKAMNQMVGTITFTHH